MQKIITLIGLLLFVGPLNAQVESSNEEKFQLPANKKVSLNLKFARTIIVKTWDNAELSLKTKIKSDEEAWKKFHQQEVKEGADELWIETSYDFPEDRKEKYTCWDCDGDSNPENKCMCLEVSYELYVPKNALLSIETISGNIEIFGSTANLKAKTISGFVDLSLKPNIGSDLHFKSVTGEIYTDFDISLDAKSTSYSKKVKTSINGGGRPIKLESISGDIFLRRI